MPTGLDTGTVKDSVSVFITSLSDFPSIAAPTFGSVVELYQPKIRTEFEGNYVQSRNRSTRTRKRWSWKWAAMTLEDYQTLTSFIESTGSSAFNFVEWVTGTPYVCTIPSDTFLATYVNKGETYYLSVELPMEQQ